MTLRATMQATSASDARSSVAKHTGNQAIVERSSVCLRKATTTASSSTDRTVDLGFLGPVGRSETDVRAFHLAMVFGLTQ